MKLSKRIHPFDLADIIASDRRPSLLKIVKNEKYVPGQIVIYKGKRYEQSLEVLPVRPGAKRFIKKNKIKLPKTPPFAAE